MHWSENMICPQKKKTLTRQGTKFTHHISKQLFKTQIMCHFVCFTSELIC